MKEASPINRTYHPKWVTYTGDGQGRDHYVIFNNGGLHQLRDYQGSQLNGFNLGPHPSAQGVTPKKEATAFDYKPDGTGRDLYVINSFGLKRNYKSDHREFEKILRSESQTPFMDTRQLIMKDATDASLYNNWPSQAAIRQNIKTAGKQRQCISRLLESPNRVSPMRKFISGQATFNINPQIKASHFMLSRASESRIQQKSNIQSNNSAQQKKLRRFSLQRPVDLKTFQMQTSHAQLSQQVGSKIEIELPEQAFEVQDNIKQQAAKRGFNLTPVNKRAQSFGFIDTNSDLMNTMDVKYRNYPDAVRQKVQNFMRKRSIRKGHNPRLDLVSDNKIVNNDPSIFFKQKE